MKVLGVAFVTPIRAGSALKALARRALSAQAFDEFSVNQYEGDSTVFT